MTKKRNLKLGYVIIGLFVLFCLLIVSVKMIDVRAIGPQNSVIGLASINGAVRDFIGVNYLWYDITELLGICALLTVPCFGILGLSQWIRRKSIRKVDEDLFLLAGFYVIVVICYIFFEVCIINYRPIILDGELEPSFPSSHIMLVICFMGTAMAQWYYRIQNVKIRNICMIISALLILLTIIGRVLSGVHWFTDCIGGVLLGSILTLAYIAIVRQFCMTILHKKKD